MSDLLGAEGRVPVATRIMGLVFYSYDSELGTNFRDPLSA